MNEIKTLASRMINLEYQLKNKDHMTSKEVAVAEEAYANDKQIMMDLFRWKRQEMGLPAEVNEWYPESPMKEVNRMADSLLAQTDAYQEVLGQMMIGAITTI